MYNKFSKLSVGIAVLFEIMLMVIAIENIATRQWKPLFLTLLAVVCLILPFMTTHIANRKKLVLPASFQSVTLVFIILAQYLGEIKKFYQVFWWWDLLLHAIAGCYAVIIALYLIKGILRKEQGTSEQRFRLFTVLFAFSFSIALGTLWEVFEFTGDYLFKSSMVKGGLEDTSTDLIIKIVAAFITSMICYYGGLRELLIQQ